MSRVPSKTPFGEGVGEDQGNHKEENSMRSSYVDKKPCLIDICEVIDPALLHQAAPTVHFDGYRSFLEGMATTNDGTANGEARGDNVLNQTSGEQGNKTNTAVNKQKQDHNNIATDSWGQEENGMVADEWKKYEGTKPENRKLFEEDTKSISSAVEEVNQFILPDGIVDGRNLEIELTTSPTGAPQNTFRYYRSASGTFQSTPVAKATAMSPEVEEPPCTHPTIDHVRMLSPEQIAASRLPRPVHPETNPVKCGVCEIEIRVRKGYKRCTWCLAIRCVKCQGTLKRK